MREQFESGPIGVTGGERKDSRIASKLSTTLKSNIDSKNAEYVDLLDGRIGVAYKKIPLERLGSELNVLYFSTADSHLYELYTNWEKFLLQHKRAYKLDPRQIEKLQAGDLILVDIDKNTGQRIIAIDREQADTELNMGSSFRYSREGSTEILHEIVGDINLPDRYKSSIPQKSSLLQVRAEKKREEWLVSLDDESKTG